MKLDTTFKICLIIMALMAAVMFFGCGPSLEEVIAKESAKRDSVTQCNQEQPVNGELMSTPYIRLIASEYRAKSSDVEVYLVGTDTIVVVSSNHSSVSVIKKEKH